MIINISVLKAYLPTWPKLPPPSLSMVILKIYGVFLRHELQQLTM